MISTSPTAWDYFGENDNRIILSYNVNKQAKTLFSFKQMILRTLKKYINGTVLLHVGKRYRIITADWIVLWGWALGSWWIPIRWLYFPKKPSELERNRWNKSQYHEVPTVSYLSPFLFRLDGACFSQPNNLKCTGEKKFSYSK